MTRPRALAPLLALLAACALAGPGGAAAQQPADTVAAAPTLAWQAALRAYQELGIPLATVEPRSLTLGNRRLVAPRALGDTPMAELLACPGLPAGGFATVRHELSVVTQLRAAPRGGTVLRTQLEARAGRPGEAPRPCRSTGRLEALIAERVRTGSAP